ncbi:MAG TPA: hypothetical protein VFJ72_08565 [Rubrobacteraceae bacterium]|nr:hypothetical protein [Rubrobacteraceae bacterium]
MASARTPYPRTDFWLIVAEKDGRVLAVDGDGTPAIFSGEGEAEMFRYLLGLDEGGWMVRRTSPGDLISVLYCHCADANKVALDPAPEMLSARLIGLVRMSKVRFIARILERVLERGRLLGNPAVS